MRNEMNAKFDLPSFGEGMPHEQVPKWRQIMRMHGRTALLGTGVIAGFTAAVLTPLMVGHGATDIHDSLPMPNDSVQSLPHVLPYYSPSSPSEKPYSEAPAHNNRSSSSDHKNDFRNTKTAYDSHTVKPNQPVRAAFIAKDGKRRVVELGSTWVKKKIRNGIEYQTIDPPLVYCPGTNPVGVTHPFTIGKTQADCRRLYTVKDYGEPHSPGVGNESEPTVLTGHKSVLGYNLPGNFVASIKRGSQLVVTLKDGDKVDYRAVRHFYPSESTNDLGVSLHNIPTSWLVLVTCDATDGYNNAVVYKETSAQHIQRS